MKTPKNRKHKLELIKLTMNVFNNPLGWEAKYWRIIFNKIDSNDD